MNASLSVVAKKSITPNPQGRGTTSFTKLIKLDIRLLYHLMIHKITVPVMLEPYVGGQES
jgi:hypothetical protein